MKLLVSVPASIANLGSGFDTFGLAIDLRNEVEIEDAKEFSLIEEGVKFEGEDLFLKTFKDVMASKGLDWKYKMKKISMIPTQKGLGSSAASIVLGIASAMEISKSFSRQKIFEMATQIEGHPDNVAASVFGGFTVSAHLKGGYSAVSMQPMWREITIVIPPFSTSTHEARKILPKMVPLEDAVFNLQRATMVLANYRDRRMLQEFFEDKLHQDLRLSIHPELKTFFEKTKSKIEDPIFLCGSGTAVAVAGTHEIKVPQGWQVIHKKTSIEGIIVRYL